MKKQSDRSSYTNQILSSRVSAIASLLLGFGMVVLAGTAKIQAAACATPATDLGATTITMNVPATATYTVWTRMKAPDTAHNSVNLQVDTSTCFNVGGGTFTATSWASGSGNWIKYQDGVTSNFTTLTNLSAGNHTFKYIGTQAGVEVDRIIISSDASCVPVGTGDNCQSGDSTGPTVNQQALASGGQQITNGQTVSGNVSLTATAADASGIDNVTFLIDGVALNTDVTSPYQYTWNTAGVSNATHVITSRATDTKGNTTTSSALSVVVSNAVPCAGNPTVPGNVRKSSSNANSISLAWDASTAASGCTLQNYRVLRGGVQVGTATGTSYTDGGLTPSTAYSYTIVATDTSSHLSAASTALSISTSADTTSPGVPTNLRSTLTTTTTAALSWNASTDDVGIKDYVVFRNGTQVGVATGTNYTDSALTANTTYSFTVKARDLANNMSASSSTLSITTLVGTSASSGDLDGSSKVDIRDLSILLSHWGQSNVPISQGDVDGSGKVDIRDLYILLTNWGKTV